MPLLYRDGGWWLDGERVTQDEIAGYRDALAERWADALGDVAIAELGIGGPRAAVEFPLGRVERFGARFLGRIAEMVASAYVAGRGGITAVTDAGWRTVVEAVARQEGYAQGFIGALRGGTVSEAEAVARARSYAGAAVEAFSIGTADQAGLSLPAHPGDGSQQCRSQCRCSWSIAEFADRWEATWTLNSAAEHCATCKANADKWRPFTQAKGGGL